MININEKTGRQRALTGSRRIDRLVELEYAKRHKPWYTGKTTLAIKAAIRAALTGEKQCSECGDVLPLDDFYPMPRTRAGYSPDCRVCRSARAAENYHRRQARIKESNQFNLSDEFYKSIAKIRDDKRKYLHRSDLSEDSI